MGGHKRKNMTAKLIICHLRKKREKKKSEVDSANASGTQALKKKLLKRNTCVAVHKA